MQCSSYSSKFILTVTIVILPGSDRDFGGLPRWLLSTNSSTFENPTREYTLEYQFFAKRWLDILLPKIAEKKFENGGPVILVQIDTDLGNTEPCGEHSWLYEEFTSQLGGTIFFTMDRNSREHLSCGTIEKVIPGIRTSPLEFAVTFKSSMKKLFAPLKKTSEMPKLVEVRLGMAWHWGGKRLAYDESELENLLTGLMKHNSSIILYMFAGGTNFERPAPGVITSYECGALVEEAGNLTQQYFRVRSLLDEESGVLKELDSLKDKMV